MRCANCDTENPERAKFCIECATPLQKRCPNCRAENLPRAKFCGECATSLAEQPASVQPSAPSSQSVAPFRSEAERRQLTVMFCDLVGSTTLSAQLDPEEYRELVHAYQQASAAVIEQFDGHIAQYLGDGLLVYFGYPAAHEDDAARAVRAGLRIIEAMHALQTCLARPLQVRIGIHTGPVVVGEMGGGRRQEQLALGETPNVAARIQGQAEPDTVLISAATYRLIEGLFDCEDRGQPALKGISAPMTVYRISSKGAAQNRFDVVVGTGLTPLIGREEELNLLRRHWAQAKAGAGQVVLLNGEPGIGKSRLMQELKEYISAEGATRIEFRCSPYHQNSALYPIIEHLQRLLQFAREDAPAVKLEKLQHTLSHYRFPQANILPLLAALLSLPRPEGSPPLTVSPQKQKEKTQAALVAWLVEETEQAAVYCTWEDLHWADPSTLEVLTLLLDQVPTTQMLVLLTSRPEFTSPWGNRSHLSQMTLSRLGRPHVEAMVRQVTRGKALPSEVMQHIVAKTDGVPLFVEELTKTVVESGLLREEASRYVGAHSSAPIPPLAIPSTLQDSLMARLDRLALVKEIAQLGATLGREFSYEVLHAVSPLDEEVLQQGLRQLVEAELLYQRGLPPHATYLFKHALIQDTAYQSLLKSTRQQYHQRIAQVLEGQSPDTKETQPELVAHHYTEAGLIAQAIPYWQQAGERATQRSANAEAVAHLTKGLEMVTALPHTPERDRQELVLQIALGTPLIAAKGWGGQEMAKAFARARQLCDQVGDTALVFRALYMQWGYASWRGEQQATQEVSEQFLELAERQGEPIPLLVAHGLLGRSLCYRGELVAGRTHIEKSLDLYNPLMHRNLAFQYGQDPHVAGLAGLAWTLWVLGYPEQAIQAGDEAVNNARAIGHAHTLAYASSVVYGLRAPLLRDVHGMEARLQTVMGFLVEQGLSPFLGMMTYVLGWLRTHHELAASGIAQMLLGRTEAQAIAMGILQPYLLTLLADAYARDGQLEQGLGVLAETMKLVEENGECWADAEILRVKGELLRALSTDNDREAERCFQNAIAVARRQRAKSWELRAAMSLARLWQQQGRRTEAHELLSDIYGWFTEGFDTKDLQEAKALLAELAGG
jgi:class 3 adenylate cyclase/predicted ATPase